MYLEIIQNFVYLEMFLTTKSLPNIYSYYEMFLTIC